MGSAETRFIRLEDLTWKNRVILVFLHESGDLDEFEKRFEQDRAGIMDRDIRYFIVGGETVLSNGDTTLKPAYVSTLREKFSIPERDVTVILIGKDGGVKYRSSELDLEHIYQEIDAMPMRIREMERSRKNIVSFTRDREGDEWVTVNDVVMGGISQSSMIMTGNSTAIFQGTVSLENSGGFASVRNQSISLDLSGYAGILIRVMGDGKTYQLRLHTNDSFDDISYRYSFETFPGRWITIRAPFDTFVPVFRGRIVTDAPPLDPSSVDQIGFLIAEKQAGPFRLEIESIQAYR